MATVMTMQSINPANGEVLASYPEMTDAEVDRALGRAQEEYTRWRKTSFAERAEKVRGLATLLRKKRDELARIASLEMGKPITQARAEVEKCAWGCEYYADNAEEQLTPKRVQSTASESYVSYRPLGVILAIMPWNFPFWQVFRPIAPAMMAGNAMVLKHASNVPQCALAIEQVMEEAGFPKGLFRTLLISGRRAERLVEDPRVKMVTLTGSDLAGSQVAGAAGRVLKKLVLELGGSDPFVVFGDADLALAAKVAAVARNQNSGQSCIAAKRFLVDEDVSNDFERRFVETVSALKVGDPLDPSTDIGPLARDDLRDALDRQVQESVAMGATVALGGSRIEGPGYFYQPTILTGVTSEMPVFREETFGPVAAVMRFKDEGEAIRLANDTVFGLGASLWTRDLKKAQELAGDVDAGNLFINGMVASDPRLPFGGVKRSGYGRELSPLGIHELVNIQTVWIGPATSTPPAPPQKANE